MLERRHPDVATLLVEDICLGSHRARMVGLGLLLDRIDDVREIPEGRAALGTLARRGLTSDILDELRAALESAQQIESIESVDAGSGLDADENAAKLWAWYLEWSAIARTVVESRKDLVRLGYG